MNQDHILKTKDHIRKIRQEGGLYLVSFPSHDGYFRIRDEDADIRKKIEKAYGEGLEVTITYDPDFTILTVE